MKKKINRKTSQTRQKRRAPSSHKGFTSLPKTLEGLGRSYEALLRELAKR